MESMARPRASVAARERAAVSWPVVVAAILKEAATFFLGAAAARDEPRRETPDLKLVLGKKPVAGMKAEAMVPIDTKARHTSSVRNMVLLWHSSPGLGGSRSKSAPP